MGSMHTSIPRLALAMSVACAIVTFGPLPQAAAAPAALLAQTPAPQWEVEVDAQSLSQNLNAWASAEGTLQTPVGAARLQQLSADIGDNELIVRGSASAGWFSLPVEATATAAAANGSVQVHVVEARVSGIDVPEAVRADLEQQLQTQLAHTIAADGAVVQSVQLADGKLAAAGTWR